MKEQPHKSAARWHVVETEYDQQASEMAKRQARRGSGVARGGERRGMTAARRKAADSQCAQARRRCAALLRQVAAIRAARRALSAICEYAVHKWRPRALFTLCDAKRSALRCRAREERYTARGTVERVERHAIAEWLRITAF